MRRATITFFAITSAFLAQSPGEAQFKGKGKSPNGWLPSLQEGKRVARETGKPMMVVLRCVP